MRKPDVTVPDTADGGTPTMYIALIAFDGDNFDQTLEPLDTDSCNFLYSPDLGDAPPLYPTYVHTLNVEGTLNGATVYEPGCRLVIVPSK